MLLSNHRHRAEPLTTLLKWRCSATHLGNLHPQNTWQSRDSGQAVPWFSTCDAEPTEQPTEPGGGWTAASQPRMCSGYSDRDHKVQTAEERPSEGFFFELNSSKQNTGVSPRKLLWKAKIRFFFFFFYRELRNTENTDMFLSSLGFYLDSLSEKKQ